MKQNAISTNVKPKPNLALHCVTIFYIPKIPNTKYWPRCIKHFPMFNHIHTWEFFLWLWAGAEGGFPPVRAASVMNKSNSQTRRTSERIFFPGETSRPVRLDVLRVLGLRPFMLKRGCCSLSLSTLECKWQKLNTESQRSRLAKIHDLHILIPSWVLFYRIQFRYWRQWRVDGSNSLP